MTSAQGHGHAARRLLFYLLLFLPIVDALHRIELVKMADIEEPVDVPEGEDPELEEEVPEEGEYEEEDEFVAVGGAAEVKLFGKWSFDDIEVRDISLVVRL